MSQTLSTSCLRPSTQKGTLSFHTCLAWLPVALLLAIQLDTSPKSAGLAAPLPGLGVFLSPGNHHSADKSWHSLPSPFFQSRSFPPASGAVYAACNLSVHATLPTSCQIPMPARPLVTSVQMEQPGLGVFHMEVVPPPRKSLSPNPSLQGLVNCSDSSPS